MIGHVGRSARWLALASSAVASLMLSVCQYPMPEFSNPHDPKGTNYQGGTGTTSTTTTIQASGIGASATALGALPRATITIDGDPADWAGIAAQVIDTVGDATGAGPGNDIASIYVAQDDTFLYWRMDLANGPPSVNFAYDLHLFAGSFGTGPPWFDSRCSFDGSKHRDSILFSFSSGGEWNRVDLHGSESASGSCIEVRVPLFALPTAQIKYVSGGVQNAASNGGPDGTSQEPISINAGNSASVVFAPANRDTFLAEGFPMNYGKWTNLEIGATPNSGLYPDPAKHHALVGFDLSGIPAGLSPSAAFLEFDFNSPTDTISAPITVYKLLRDWDEGTGTQINGSTYDGANWANARFSTAGSSVTGVAWGAPGCSLASFDYDPVPLGSITVTGTGRYSLDIPVSEVQRLLADPVAARRGYLITDNDAGILKIGLASLESGNGARICVVGGGPSSGAYNPPTPKALRSATAIVDGNSSEWQAGDILYGNPFVTSSSPSLSIARFRGFAGSQYLYLETELGGQTMGSDTASLCFNIVQAPATLTSIPASDSFVAGAGACFEAKILRKNLVPGPFLLWFYTLKETTKKQSDQASHIFVQLP